MFSMDIPSEYLRQAKIWCSIFLLLIGAANCEIWQRPGCHLVGHSQKVEVHGCIAFWAQTNACRGYCESYSIPSTKYQLQNNPNLIYTSRSTCCNIVEYENVNYAVMCLGGKRTFTFRSATRCECFYCNKD